VNIAPRYLGRGSWLARRDPRVLILVVVLFVFTVSQVWDLRLVLALDAIAFGYYRLAGIPFHEVRRNWIAALTLITIIVLVNTVLTGNRFEGVEQHVFLTIPLLGTPVSAESISYAITQWLRYVAMIAVGFPVAFCVAPSDFGVTFARLGIPYKLAFAVDLTFRFLPSLAGEYQQTIDAQRVRGYNPGGGGNPIARLRRSVPLIVPFAVNAIVGAEDTIDAMDLRGFGTGKRTWVRHLAFDRPDRLILVAFAGLLVGATIAGFTTTSSHPWTPQFLIDLANR
jgi:energy-coupling factor transport system permease protein